MNHDAVHVATWNLQGSRGVDAPAVARRLRSLAPSGTELDVVVLQEVRRRQARAVAAALGLASVTWGFKHWAAVSGPEGMAVLSRHELHPTSVVHLRPAPFWSWRRRITVLAGVCTPWGSFVVADVHFSPHSLAEQRRAEVDRLIMALDEFGAGRAALVVGDVNDHPGQFAHAKLLGLGWRDAWTEVHGDQPEPAGATNWTAGPRHGRPPTQRLDYVLVPAGWTVDRVETGRPDDDGFDGWAVLSDHLPVAASLRPSDDA